MTNDHYVTTGRLRFRFIQILVNAVALLAIAGGLAAYFKSKFNILLHYWDPYFPQRSLELISNIIQFN